MNVTLSSLFVCVLTTNILIIMLSLILLKPNTFLNVNPTYILLCILYIIIKSFLPYEFFYTYTLKSRKIMPYIQKLTDYNLDQINITVLQLFLIIWGAGAFIKMIRLLFKQYKMEKNIRRLPNSKYMPVLRELISQNNIKGTIDLVEIPGLRTPAIVGFRKTKIIIPTNIIEKDLHFILLHELEHYKRHDLYFIAILHFICIIYWWNPILYLLKVNAQQFIELRVDKSITERMNEDDKVSYIESILNVAKSVNNANTSLVFGVGFYERQSDLYKRFSNVLYGKNKRTGYIVSLLILSLSILSTSIIIEPYAINKNDEQCSYRISESSYFIRRGEYYDLYLNGTYYITSDRVDKFEDVKIYNSMEEKNEKNQKNNY